MAKNFLTGINIVGDALSISGTSAISSARHFAATSITTTGDISATGADFNLQHPSGATIFLRRDDTSISDGNTLGLINFQGDDPTDGTFNTGVAIMGKAAGDWASSSYESEFIVQTRNTSGGLVTALTLNEAQNATFTGTVTAPRFNIDSTSNYIDTISSYLSFKSGGNEMTFGGATAMYVNWRAALGGTPTHWTWNAGSSSTHAKFTIGELDARGDATFAGNISLADSKYVYWGGSNDFYIGHDGNNTGLVNSTGHLYISNYADNKDIVFQNDDGSGGVTEYYKVDGLNENIKFSVPTVHIDSKSAYFGTGGDLQIFHNGSNSHVQNATGDLYVENLADDKDVIFRCDDGSGGFTPYLYLDGSAAATNDYYTVFPDYVRAAFGDGKDLKIWHDATSSYIRNETGSLYIESGADDNDMYFRCDDSSGGLTNYFYLDGSKADGTNVYTIFPDQSILGLGAIGDLMLYHNGTNSFITNNTGDITITSASGEMIFTQNTDDGNINFNCDDMSGGVTTYITIDGGEGETNFLRNTNHADSVYAQFGTGDDLKIYHDGSNSYIDDTATGSLRIRSSDIQLEKYTGEMMLVGNSDGAVTLYYDGSIKLATVTGGVNVTGTLTATADVIAYSDERLKTNIETLDGSKVYDMRGVSFTKDDKQGSGVIAQELEKIAPELVNDDSEYKAVAYGNITGYLIEAIKDLKAEIEELKNHKCNDCTK